MSPACFPAFLYAISGGEPSERFGGTRQGVDFPAQISLSLRLLANDAGSVETNEVFHESVGEVG